MILCEGMRGRTTIGTTTAVRGLDCLPFCLRQGGGKAGFASSTSGLILPVVFSRSLQVGAVIPSMGSLSPFGIVLVPLASSLACLIAMRSRIFPEVLLHFRMVFKVMLLVVSPVVTGSAQAKSLVNRYLLTIATGHITSQVKRPFNARIT